MSLRTRQAQTFALAKRVGGFFIKSHILTVWVGLCVVGFIVGTQARPEPTEVPYDDLFEDLHVLSYREAPSDSAVRPGPDGPPFAARPESTVLRAQLGGLIR